MKSKLGYEIKTTNLFDKLVKELKKNFRHISTDIDNYSDDLDDISKLGVHLGNNIYKARISNTDKSTQVWQGRAVLKTSLPS